MPRFCELSCGYDGGGLGGAMTPAVARLSSVAERQPSQRIAAGAAPDTSFAIDKAEALDFIDRAADIVRANSGQLNKLTARCHQEAVALPAVTHVLDHESVYQAARVDAERAPCVALQQVAGQLDEGLAFHGRPPLFNTSSQSVSAPGGI